MAALPIVVVAGVVMQQFLKHTPTSTNPVFGLFEQPPSGFQLMGLFLLVGVVGPAFEELLFRGVLLSSFRQVMGPAPAIFLSAAIFSIVHGDLPGLVPIFILGSVMGYIFNKTGSLVPSFVMHSLQNSATFLFVVFLVT
jgi:membrane protease YdiL (CAAX protease family)